MRTKFVGITSIAILSLTVLAGCGTTGNSNSTSTSTSGSTITLKNSDWSKITSGKYKNDNVDLTGQIFSDPITSGNTTQYQMWLNPSSQTGNVVFQIKNGSKLKNNNYVEIKGTLEGSKTAKNAFGADVTVQEVQATSAKKISRNAAVAPTIKTVKGIASQSQHGLTIEVAKVEFAKNETRVYLSATNKTGSNASVDDYDSTLVQGSSQIKQKDITSGIPTFPDEIANGVTANAELVFKAAKLNGKPLKFTTSVSDDNFDLSFHNYTYMIPTK